MLAPFSSWAAVFQHDAYRVAAYSQQWSAQKGLIDSNVFLSGTQIFTQLVHS